MIEIAREKLTCEGGGYTTRKDKIETVFSKKYYAHIFPETRPQESNIYLPRILHIFFYTFNDFLLFGLHWAHDK